MAQTYHDVPANSSCSAHQTQQVAWTSATTIATVSLVIMAFLNMGALAIATAQFRLAKKKDHDERLQREAEQD
ncbi:hypothetical protein SLS58_011174 [Diplodia intermedia]|uniref:Uncharacterized protein n=1 Tax=Diplodia intermedia TaxID=856260 RepID=A0ABR3T0X7_9PEZI